MEVIRKFIGEYRYFRSKDIPFFEVLIRAYHHTARFYHSEKYFYSSFYYPQHKLIKHREKMEYHNDCLIKYPFLGVTPSRR